MKLWLPVFMMVGGTILSMADNWMDTPAPGTHVELLLWPREVPEKQPGISETVTYRFLHTDDVGFNRVVKDISVPTLTVYRPAVRAYGGSAIIICPGGAYGAVVIDREGFAIARWLQQQGITAAVLKYRMPTAETFVDGLPVSQRDALQAIRFLRDRAKAWNISTDRIGIMGFSAGGHLAGSAAVFGVATDGSRPDFVALIYPVVLMDGPYVHKGTRDNLIGSDPVLKRVEAFSLERRVERGWPPFFIAHAKDDTGVPVQNSTLLADALRANGVPVELFLAETGGHGFSMGRGADSSQWPERFLNWLNNIP